MKHSKSESTDQNDETHSNIPVEQREQKNQKKIAKRTLAFHTGERVDGKTISNSAKRKRKNQQQIIYVMPGPIVENVRTAHRLFGNSIFSQLFNTNLF